MTTPQRRHLVKITAIAILIIGTACFLGWRFSIGWVAIGILCVFLCLWFSRLNATENTEAGKAAREVLEVVAAVVIFINLYPAWEAVMVSREAQLTSRYSQAVTNLGSQNLEIRLGGIYALERIAKESQIDYSPTMEILTAYVRTHSPRNEPQLKGVDVQAVITVIGRRSTWFQDISQRIDLHSTNLSGALLEGANLEGVAFTDAVLQRAVLSQANLQKAIFLNTDLRRARLEGADLRGANFGQAKLEGANLKGSNLQGTIGLTRQQIQTAFTDMKTRLPDNLH